MCRKPYRTTYNKTYIVCDVEAIQYNAVVWVDV